jgi:predicted GNAT family acetyltransferase
MTNTQTDKTGAPTTVSAESDRFTIAVDGQEVGKLEFRDSGDRRVFTHTEVDDNYEGRGLATILIGEALQETRDAGLRIVAECPTVANYVSKHDEFSDVVDD